MAQTDLLSQEDIEDIGAVIQLSPHARTSEFEMVTKSSEDETLVSLDELYEKTGQESINIVVQGFKLLTEKGRLARKHGQALNIKGAESWLPVADKLNVIRGGEGFFQSLKDGLVNFIKAIIRFIKGICNWIGERIKRLFGFEKTIKETQYLNEKTDTINKAMSGMILELGGGKEFDPIEFLNTLPKGRTDIEQLTLIKNNLDSAETTIQRIIDSLPAFKEATDYVEKLGLNVNKASKHYRDEISELRAKFKAKNVTVADIIRFNQYLQEDIFITLDYSELAGILKILNDSFYGIKIDDLGVEGTMSKVRERLKSQVSIVSERLTPELTKKVKEARRHIATFLEKENSKGISLNNMKFTEKSFNKFQNVIELSDAEFIKELSDKLDFQEAKDLNPIYATCIAKIREYDELVDNSLKTLYEVGNTYTNICNWYSKVSALVAVYLTRDVKRIMEAHKKWLTDEERAEVETNGKPTYLFDFEADFNKRHPGLNLPEEFSRIAVILQEVDKTLYNDRIGKFVSQLKG